MMMMMMMTMMMMMMMMMMMIIIIIIRNVLGLDRPVSASSNSLFEGLPNILHPILL
jgi:hypothetical protein